MCQQDFSFYSFIIRLSRQTGVRFFLISLKKQNDVMLGKIEREQLLEMLAPLEEKMLEIARVRGRSSFLLPTQYDGPGIPHPHNFLQLFEVSAES